MEKNQCVLLKNDTLNYIFNLEFFDLIRKEKCHKIRIGDLGIPRKKRAGVIFCYLIVIFLFLADYWSYAHFLPGKTLMTVIVAFDNGLVRSQCDQRDYHAFTCIIRKKQTLNLPLSNHILDEIEYLECRPQGLSKLKV